MKDISKCFYNLYSYTQVGDKDDDLDSAFVLRVPASVSKKYFLLLCQFGKKVTRAGLLEVAKQRTLENA